MVDILGAFEAIKVFIKEESDTLFGLVFFLVVGLSIIKYILEEPLANADVSPLYASAIATILIISFWLYYRRIPVTEGKLTIAIAPFNLLMLNPKSGITGEAKRDLKRELVDYIYSALHFNKERLYLDKHLEIVRLPNRVKVSAKNAANWAERLGIDLLIWGETYYDENTLHFKPRFQFLREPSNVYYSKFRKALNNLKTFKIKLTDNVEKQDTEIARLMHYLSFLGLTFHGIGLTHDGKYEQAQEVYSHVLHQIHKKAFHNKTLADIYLATRFFAAQNYHKWGNHLIKTGLDDEKAMKLYEKGARAFFKRAQEMEELHDFNEQEKIEHTMLYGIHLLVKEGAFRQANLKLESMKSTFTKENMYLYYLYKGLLQKTPKKAKPFFDKALKLSKNDLLCYEKIADYFFAKGKSDESIAYFEKRFKISNTKVYEPSLLEDESHKKLSVAYLKHSQYILGIKERIQAQLSERENKHKHALVE